MILAPLFKTLHGHSSVGFSHKPHCCWSKEKGALTTVCRCLVLLGRGDGYRLFSQLHGDQRGNWDKLEQETSSLDLREKPFGYYIKALRGPGL